MLCSPGCSQSSNTSSEHRQQWPHMQPPAATLGVCSLMLATPTCQFVPLRWQHLQLVSITVADMSSVASGCAHLHSGRVAESAALFRLRHSMHLDTGALEEATSERNISLQLHGPIHGLVASPYRGGHGQNPTADVEQPVHIYRIAILALWPDLGVVVPHKILRWHATPFGIAGAPCTDLGVVALKEPMTELERCRREDGSR